MFGDHRYLTVSGMAGHSGTNHNWCRLSDRNHSTLYGFEGLTLSKKNCSKGEDVSPANEVAYNPSPCMAKKSMANSDCNRV